MTKIGTSTPATYEPYKYGSVEKLYDHQELFGTTLILDNQPGATNAANYKYEPASDGQGNTAANVFQTEIGLGDKPYTLRTTGAIVATAPAFAENAVFNYLDKDGNTVKLEATYVQQAGANTDKTLIASNFANDAATEKGWIEYFNLAPITTRIGELDTDIAKAKANIASTNARSGEAAKQDIAELEAQQTEVQGVGSLFSKRDGKPVIGVDYTTPIKIGGITVGFSVDYAQKSEAIAKEIDALRPAANAARAAWDATSGMSQKVQTAQGEWDNAKIRSRGHGCVKEPRFGRCDRDAEENS
jgi:hypothetical protein